MDSFSYTKQSSKWQSVLQIICLVFQLVIGYKRMCLLMESAIANCQPFKEAEIPCVSFLSGISFVLDAGIFTDKKHLSHPVVT